MQLNQLSAARRKSNRLRENTNFMRRANMFAPFKGRR